MTRLQVRVLRELPDGVEVGSEPCACGGCRPTASVFRADPDYARHDGALAQGPCCCGRFFVVGPQAESRARALAEVGRGTAGYAFARRTLALPWGGELPVVVADLAE